MDVFEAIQARRSIRRYQDKPVSRETLTKLLEAARVAPSAYNFQPWHFIVVTDAEKRRELSKGTFAKFLADAPAVIVACGDAEASPDWYAVDASLAIENLILAATGEGLATCCVGSFTEEDIKKAVGIPENLSVIVLVSVGYPKKETSKRLSEPKADRSRRELGDIASWETYDKRA